MFAGSDAVKDGLSIIFDIMFHLVEVAVLKEFVEARGEVGVPMMV